ncbi:TerC/Alx family metal homeostasis membrane protein [Bradyrhizobium pachyrhizi]|uniref:TerC/Alx family metal homeostasis membrane protein n=1 Tax=Bradyrhizobium pachyrhizi TaxID=280333 RepID=UPI0024B18C50|nr:TerC/Alx family metal homeostasis membrane protein [Bradyrhizobium pachyrhizi]WFU58424.1 TerC/Alx family metal homeostasis membrane protein [Bradyrhizobium pachyrhizi]
MWLWVAFIVFVFFLVALDLGVLHREARTIAFKEALMLSAGWITVALAFNVVIFFLYENHWCGLDLAGSEPDGRAAAVLFLTGFLIEKSLGLDNLFFIALIFSYFRIPIASQHRVLYWGILGAVIMRAAMILAGTALIERVDWILYIFGAFLIVSGVRMGLVGHPPDIEKNPIIIWIRRFFPVFPKFAGERFVVRRRGQLALTPLALALIMIEASDLIFALDSIPAIFSITRDSFLVFTSNIMALLGLRSLYFALSGAVDRFRYLRTSLGLLLVLIGIKLLLKDVLVEGPTSMFLTLGAVAILLASGVIASLLFGRRASNCT